MKKKATMLIQHLEAVYTMYPKRNTIKHHAFIAVYHDRILKIGSGTGREFIDKDTRIIEGRNHIALPGFIDIDVRSEALKQQTSDTPYQLQSLSGTLLRHGTMLIHNETVLSEVKEQLRHPSMIDVHTKSYQSKVEICRPLTMKHDFYDKSLFVSAAAIIVSLVLINGFVQNYTQNNTIYLISLMCWLPVRYIPLVRSD